MRIGIITQAYYPITGGVTEHVFYQAKYLKELGHQPTIITSRFVRSNHHNHDDHLDVVRIGWNVPIPIPMNGSFNCINIGPSTRSTLKKICADKKFDIVHVHCPVDPILPLLAVATLDLPLVGTFHSYSKSALLFDFFRRQYGQLLQRLQGKIAVSNAAREYIQSYFSGDYKIIPNGVDMSRFNAEAQPLPRFKDGYFNILFVGRMAPRKGLKNLLRAFTMVCQKYPKTRLIVVGNGLLADYYKLYYPAGMSDRIIFVGYVPREQLAHYYASADIYCSPATGGESFGIVLLEAMAMGVPIVATAIRGYSDVVRHEQEALMVPPADPLVLRDAIIRLMEDEPLRRRLTAAGREKVKNYSWPAVVGEIVKMYEEIVNRKKA
jgi:phosphatidyl-myo-inositol alpha-mannosyltransferase